MNLKDEYLKVVKEIETLSVLEKTARRLTAQVGFINRALEITAGISGQIWELGLGDGRTLEHIVRHAAVEKIVVFEKEVSPKIALPKERIELVTGDFFTTIPRRLRNAAGRVKLVHADVGTRDFHGDLAALKKISGLLHPFLCDGAVVICDRPLPGAPWKLVETAHHAGWPYYMWINSVHP